MAERGFSTPCQCRLCWKRLMEGNGESEASDGRDVPWFNGDPDG